MPRAVEHFVYNEDEWNSGHLIPIGEKETQAFKIKRKHTFVFTTYG